MQLLANSERHTAQVMGLATTQIATVARMNQRKEEFAMNHALQKEQIAAQSQYYAQQTANASARNNIANKKFEMERKLFPIREREANAKLKAAEVDLERASQGQAKAAVDTVFKPYDDVVAANFSSNRTPEYVEGYHAIRAKAEAEVQAGGEFDSEKFRQEIMAHNAKYDGVKNESKEYDPEVRFWYQSLGNTKGAARYEAEMNPKMRHSMTGIRSQILNAGEEEFDKIMGSNAHFFSDEDIVSMRMGRDSLSALSAEINHLGETRTQVEASLLGLSPEDTSYPSLIASRAKVNQDFAEAVIQRQNMNAALMSGQAYDPNPEPEVAANTRGKDNLKKLLGTSAPATGSVFGEGKESVKQGVRVTGQVDMKEAFSTTMHRETPFGTNKVDINPLGGLDVSFFGKQAGPSFMKTVNRFTQGARQDNSTSSMIRGTVARNIEAADLSDSELMSLIKQPIVEETLAKKRIDIPTKENFFAIGQGGLKDSVLDADASAHGVSRFSITNKEDLEEYITGEKTGRALSDAEKRNRLISIYGSIVAAAVEQRAIENE